MLSLIDFYEYMTLMRLVVVFTERDSSVLNIKSQYIPEVVVVRPGATGIWGAGKGGWVSWVEGTNGVSLQTT